ncbi:MAG: histidine phosphatase family protein [Proteobacteria bacterium]|nr:histidine phosphatase family protein [Pseudomonadota bacterium]
MSALALLRHGPTASTEQGRLQGQRDVPLSAHGRAAILDWKLPGWVSARQWVTSPLSRARETAQILGGRDIITERRLIEMNWGRWEGEVLLELRQRYGRAMAVNEARGLDFRPEGGESPRQLLERVQPWLNEIGAAGNDVFAVTHKGVLRAIMAKATGWDMTGKPPVRIEWGTLHIFEVDGAGNLRMKDAVQTMAERS